MMRIKTQGTLTAAGRLQGKSELSFGGANDDRYRGSFSHMKPDDRQRFFERVLKQTMPGAKLTSLKITPEDMLDVTSELKAELGFSADGLTASGKGIAVVNLPWIGNTLGAVNVILNGTGLDARKYPLQTRLTCGLREELSLKLGEGFSGAESAPSYAPVDDECVSYHQTFAVQNGALDCSRELKLKTVEFSPAQYAVLKRTLKDLEYDTRKAPVLAMTGRSPEPGEKSEQAAGPAVDSNTIVLDSQKELEVTDSHSAVYKIRYAKKILTYAGKIREAEVKVNYNPACEEVRFIRGTVISKTGERQEISKGEMNVMDAAWNASAKRYTGGKVLVANLPGVDLGSTIEVEYELAVKGKPFIAGFESFQLPDELTKKSFELTAPANVKVEKLVTGNGPHEAVFPAGSFSNQIYHWSAENAKALPAEPLAPPVWAWISGVAYFVGDYSSYLKELNEALQKRSLARARVEAVVRPLIGSSKTETVVAIRNFVSKSIRQAGPSFADLPLAELSAADVTLTEGYGNGMDRAILLHAMLSAAGFQPEFVLASPLPDVAGINKVATSFPLPDSFSVPLVRVTVEGETYYLNDTDEYARLGSTQFEGRLGLALSSGSCQVIKAAKDCQDKTETVYTLSIADDGKLQMGVTERYFGAQYNRRHRYLSELRPEERKRYWQQLVSSVAQGARPVGELSDQFEGYPGIEHYAVEVDNYAVVDGKYLYFDLPFTPSLFEYALGGDRRTLPMLLSQEGKRSVRTEIELPPGFRGVVVSPSSQSFDAPSGVGKVRINASSTAGKFVLNDEFETSPGFIDPKDYSSMLKLESSLGKKSAKVMLLRKE